MKQDKSLLYAVCYCEENIWHLAREPRFTGCQTLVVMISGKGAYRRLWRQRNAGAPSLPVLWDYHVVMLSQDEGWWVWDLDSTLQLPVPADTYFPATFLDSGVDVENCDVILRLIPGAEYIQHFSSDRSHMKLASGEWLAEPPPWPMIEGEGSSNLLDWLDVGKIGPGRVLELGEFMRAYLSAPPGT